VGNGRIFDGLTGRAGSVTFADLSAAPSLAATIGIPSIRITFVLLLLVSLSYVSLRKQG